MTLRISGKNMDVGEAIRTQAQERVTAALAKYYEGGFNGHVTLARDGTGFRADAVLHLSSGITLEAAGTAHEAYQSLDRMVERIEKRLRRYKRRLKDHAAADTRQGAVPFTSYVIAAPDEDLEEEEPADRQGADGEHAVIIAENTKLLHELSVSNAVAELDLSGAPVLVFRHAGTARVNIVYRRGDGHIGWIDPPASGQG